MLKFLPLLVTLFIPTIAQSAALDEYYLSAFGFTPARTLRKASVLSGDISKCGTPLKKMLRRDWNRLEPATQKTLAKVLQSPVLSGERTYTSPEGHFLIHYAASGIDAPPAEDANNNFVPDWVETVARTFDEVYVSFQIRGYRPAPTSYNGRYDIYMRQLAGSRIYGQTTSLNSIPSSGFAYAYPSYIEIDNDFTDDLYLNARSGPYTPLASLQVTAAHEYHHAIQFGYNYYFEIWYGEASATWYEDELYDNVNQLYNYIPNWFGNSRMAIDIPADTPNGGGYGRWIFNRFLAEMHGASVILKAWEKLAGIKPVKPDDPYYEIPMVPVLDFALRETSERSSIGDNLFGFAKRLYRREWSSHLSDASRIEYQPVNTFGTYPVSGQQVTLPHYSFAFYKFEPKSGLVGDELRLKVSATSGIKSTLFSKKPDGTITEVSADVDSTFVINSFSTLSEVVLLLVNQTSSKEDHMASFSSDGSLAVISEPTGASVYPTHRSGDCDMNGTVVISEVQNAINNFLGLKNPEACVDTDSSGQVSISEVQKSINAFLGL